jgi:type IV secretory pathway TrbL component
MQNRIRLLLLTVPMLTLAACTTLSDKDQAALDTAVQNAAAAKQEADQALAAAQAAQAAAAKAQSTADQASSGAATAAQSAAQAAADAKDIKDKSERMFQRSLRKP